MHCRAVTTKQPPSDEIYSTNEWFLQAGFLHVFSQAPQAVIAFLITAIICLCSIQSRMASVLTPLTAISLPILLAGFLHISSQAPKAVIGFPRHNNHLPLFDTVKKGWPSHITGISPRLLSST